MKKKLLFVISFLLFCDFTYSQNSFITTIVEDKSINFPDIIQLNNSKYITASIVYIDDQEAYTSFYKIDSVGQVIHQYDKIISDTSIELTALSVENENNFLSIEHVYSLDSVSSFYYMINKYDQNFNLLKSYKEYWPDSSTTIHRGIVTKDNTKMYFINTDGYKSKIIGNIKEDTIITHDVYDYFIIDLQIIDSIHYCMVVQDSSADIHLKKIRISDFQEIQTLRLIDANIPNGGFSNMFLEIENNLIILSSSSNDNNNHFVTLDTSFNVINNQTINTDFEEFPAYYRGLDYKISNNYYFLNTDFWGYEIELTKIDSNLNILFQKFIQFDTMHLIYKIIATNDGGALVATQTCDDNNFFRILKFYKFDQYGNLPTNLPSDIKISDFAVYPNPATNFINIKKGVQIEQAEFVLYNSAGQMVLQSALNEDVTSLNVSNLQIGVYIYNILENGQVVDRGKTIVE